jgi:spore germination protein GerM
MRPTQGVRAAVVALAAALALTACGASVQVTDVGAAPTRATPDGADARGPGSDVAGSGPAPDQTIPSGSAAEQPSEPVPEPQGTTTLRVWLVEGERAVPVMRQVPRVPRIGAAVLQELLEGPTSTESGQGLSTQIPRATRLRGLTITDGVASVDLSGDFEEGGGTLALTLRLAQVVCTLDQFPTVDGVRFALDGAVVDVFSGEGLIIDEPVACSDYAEVADQ